MEALLAGLLNVSIVTFAVASMLSVGFGHTLREVMGPLRNVRSVAEAILASFVLVPVLAFAVARLFGLDGAIETGLLLIGMAAGAPFLIKLTEAASHDVGRATSLLVLLLPVTIVYMPLVVPLVVPDATVSALAIARPLVLTMLLPLGIGFAVKALAPGWARHLQPVMGMVSSLALVVLVLTTFVVNIEAIAGMLGTGAIPAAALLILGAFAIGYALGGPDTGNRAVLGLGTAQRNVAAATVVANRAIGEADTLAMVIVSSLVALAILFPIAWALDRRTGARARDVIDLHMTGRGRKRAG